MGDVNATTTAGVDARGYRRAASGTGPWDQYVIPVEDKVVSYTGRCTTFYTPGRAATTQKLMAIHNATASAVLVSVNRVRVDLLTTVAKLPTIIPPVIRLVRFTAVPTNGTALTKGTLDTQYTSSSSVTLWGDASADNTGSATTLTITPGTPVDQVWAPRMITAAGYEPADYPEFLVGEPDVVLRALEGIVVYLDAAVVTTGNPATDKWIATIDWTEYTRP